MVIYMVSLEKNTNQLLEMLISCEVSDTEFEHRKNALKAAHRDYEAAISDISNRYYSLAHEIRSFHFLKQFGALIISEDSKHESGCDFLLNNTFQIECVCSSAGKDTEKNGFSKLCTRNNLNGQLVDYGKKKEILYCRLTSSIKEKLNFYEEHIKKGATNPDMPYIIFLGLGALSHELFPGENGIEFTSILYGKGNPTLLIDTATGQTLNCGYAHNRALVNHNNAEINCNIFSSEEYRCISGIMISAAGLEEKYTFENTWLFLNPNAKIKIASHDFSDMVCWDMYSKFEYGPYRSGKQIG